MTSSSEAAASTVGAPTATRAAAMAYATDWRRQSRLLGPATSRWAVPATDAAATTALLLVAAVEATFITCFGPLPVYVANVGLCVLVALAQLWARRSPRTSFLVTAAGLAAYAVLVFLSPVNLGLSPLALAALWSVHAVVRWDGARTWYAAVLVVALAGCLVNPLALAILTAPRTGVYRPEVGTDGSLVTGALSVLVCALAVVLTAVNARARRHQVEDRYRELWAAARAAREGAAAQERLQLARELHDLLGHSLTAIKVQAATGLAVGTPEVESQALGTISDTAAASLAELRELVHVLRGVEGVDPTAGLGALVLAVDRARSSGLQVSAELPDAAEIAQADAGWTRMQRLAVVRAVQEGLTNSLRHGDGTASLHVAITPGRCVIEIRNPVSARSTGAGEGTGTGLEGLRERLSLVGGTLETGPAPLSTDADPDNPRARSGRTDFLLRATVPVPSPDGGSL